MENIDDDFVVPDIDDYLDFQENNNDYDFMDNFPDDEDFNGVNEIVEDQKPKENGSPKRSVAENEFERLSTVTALTKSLDVENDLKNSSFNVSAERLAFLTAKSPDERNAALAAMYARSSRPAGSSSSSSVSTSRLNIKLENRSNLRSRPLGSEVQITIEGDGVYFLPMSENSDAENSLEKKENEDTYPLVGGEGRVTSGGALSVGAIRMLLAVVNERLAQRAESGADDRAFARISATSTSAASLDALQDDAAAPAAGNDSDNEDAVAVRLLARKRGAESALWSAKYAPRGIMELLSPDAANKELLKWLKSWDTVNPNRAGSKTRPFEAEESGSGAVASGASRMQRKLALNAVGAAATQAGPTALLPFHKVILLHGPPGSGKTTLAHAAAAHMGYSVSEVNASDVRTGAEIRQLITELQSISNNAFGQFSVSGGSNTSSTTASGSGTSAGGSGSGSHAANAGVVPNRGTCIILDEIDGLDGSATGGVAALVQMVQDTVQWERRRLAQLKRKEPGAAAAAKDTKEGAADSDSDDDTKLKPKEKEKDSKESKKHLTYLRQPVICICNDLYAPQLRTLRPLAKLIEIPPAAPEKLQERLREICERENIAASAATLKGLVTHSGGDVRLCLNTLQFAKAQQRHRAAPVSIDNADFSVNGKVVPGPLPVASAPESGSAAGEPRLLREEMVRLTQQQVEKALVGSKDETQALPLIWKAVFASPALYARAQLRSPRGAMYTFQPSDKAASFGSSASAAPALEVVSVTPAEYLWSQTDSLESGDAALLLSGIFEHYLHIRQSDHSLQRTCGVIEWLCYGDICSMAFGSGICRTRNARHSFSSSGAYSLLRYVSVAVVGVHSRARSDLPPARVGFPREEHRQRQRAEAAATMLGEWALERRAVAGAMAQLGVVDAALDLLSPLLSMVLPRLRTVNLGLMNSLEKEVVRQLIAILKASALEFAADDRGNYLKPNIESLLFFGDQNPFDKEVRNPPISSTLRELLNSELRLSRARQARLEQTNTNSHTPAFSSSPLGQSIFSPQSKSKVESKSVSLPAHVLEQLRKGGPSLTGLSSPSAGTSLEKSEPMEVSSSNFLSHIANLNRDKARPVRKRGQDEEQMGDTSLVEAEGPKKRSLYPVLYKFHEGFSNAVKRKLVIADLFEK